MGSIGIQLKLLLVKMDSKKHIEDSEELQTVWVKADLTADRETAFLSGIEEFSESSSAGIEENMIKPIENVKLEHRKGSNNTECEVVEIVDRSPQEVERTQLIFHKGFEFLAYTPSKDSLSSSTSEEVIRSPKVFHDSLEDSEDFAPPNKESFSPLASITDPEEIVASEKPEEQQKQNKGNEESEVNAVNLDDKKVSGRLESFTYVRDGLPASSKEEVRERKALGEFSKQKEYKDAHGRAICAKCCVW